jgi:hypothetical protein
MSGGRRFVVRAAPSLIYVDTAAICRTEHRTFVKSSQNVSIYNAEDRDQRRQNPFQSSGFFFSAVCELGHISFFLK